MVMPNNMYMYSHYIESSLESTLDELESKGS
jgi:hypothetical protein